MAEKSERLFGNYGIASGRKKIFVIAAAALMIGTGFMVFAPGAVRADAAILLSQTAGPSPIAQTGTFTALSNWSHVNDPGPPQHRLSMGELYFMLTGSPGCSGTALPGMPQWFGGVWVAFWQNLMPNTLPDWAGPGTYDVTMRVQSNPDMTWSACSPAIQIVVTGADNDPPYVAQHGIEPPLGFDPIFTVNPAVTTTVLQYTVTDELSGGSDITDAEYFYCAEVVPGVPCGPDPSWVNDTGFKPDTPLPLNPWWPLPPPPPQTWNTDTRLFLNSTIDVSLWTPGTYWFYIHGADCGANAICEGGTGDDNWGVFQDGLQRGTRWFEISLDVGTGPINFAPELSWTKVTGSGWDRDGLDPENGDTSTVFEYRVNYTDRDDDAPGNIDLYIDKPCGTPWGGPFAMTELDPLDLDYTDGKHYYYTTMLPVGTDFGYYFNASDSKGAWASGDPGGDPTRCTNNPRVSGGAVPPAAPANLWVERSLPNDIIVHWDASARADSYNVYISTNDRFAAFPWPAVVEPTTSYVHSGALSDTNTYFYVVRAYNATTGESTNSTMGVKLYKSFGTPYSPMRNLYWMSLPYVSMYKKAKDITDELTNANINSVCKWTPSKQNSQCYTYWAGRWRGANFDIGPGDGILVNSINTWSWAINGTDIGRQLSFTFNPNKGNTNWISLPYTNSYVTASDVVMAIEGPSMGSTKISAVAMWDPATQAVMRYYWSGSAWTGTDFNIMPGEGYYLEIISSFTWTPDLITPSVP